MLAVNKTQDGVSRLGFECRTEPALDMPGGGVFSQLNKCKQFRGGGALYSLKVCNDADQCNRDCVPSSARAGLARWPLTFHALVLISAVRLIV